MERRGCVKNIITGLIQRYEQCMLIGNQPRAKMHPVERRCKVPFFSLISVSLNDLVHKLELQEQGDAGQFKAHIVTTARLTFINQ